ncbi:MAG: hypothetical protein MUF21_00370 [Gemmatimonadaceae bacterium]|nr:hypothetical protein [Gemmatimonadaceae bacterium]
MTATRLRTCGAALAVAWRHDVDDWPRAAAWSPDGRSLAVLGAAGRLWLLDARTGDERTHVDAHGGGVTLAWSATRGVLATGGEDGLVRLWSTTLAPLATLDPAAVVPPPAHDDARRADAAGHAPRSRARPWIEALTWSRDGRRLAVAAGRHVVVWDEHDAPLFVSPAQPSTIAALCWHPKLAQVTAAGYNGARSYVIEGTASAGRTEWKGSFLSVAWSPDGRNLAAGMQEGAVHIWQPGRPDLQMSGYPSKVRAIAWDVDGKRLATGGGDVVSVWKFVGDGPAGTRPQLLEGHALGVSALAFRHSGLVLASGGEEGITCLFDLTRATTEPIASALGIGEVSTVAWDPAGAHVASTHASGLVVSYVRPLR